MTYRNRSERPRAYWEFRDTLARAQEVTDVLGGLREQVAAGQPLPQSLALALLDEVIAQREPHLTGETHRAFRVDENVEVCNGCGEQVTSVWRGPGAEPQDEPGVCRHVTDWNFIVRGALGMPTPNLDEHYAAAQALAAESVDWDQDINGYEESTDPVDEDQDINGYEESTDPVDEDQDINGP